MNLLPPVPTEIDIIRESIREILNPELKKYLYEPINDDLRDRIRNTVEEFIENIKRESKIEPTLFENDIKIQVVSSPAEYQMTVRFVPLTKRGYEILEELNKCSKE